MQAILTQLTPLAITSAIIEHFIDAHERGVPLGRIFTVEAWGKGGCAIIPGEHPVRESAFRRRALINTGVPYTNPRNSIGLTKIAYFLGNFSYPFPK